MNIPRINLNDYTYILPDERIAKFPLVQRDHSKLLVYNKGVIAEKQFFNLPELLPGNTLLVFNNTKVIPARIFFRRSSGALIEIFLLEPVLPSPVVAIAMGAKGSAVWKCMIGNLKKWKDDEILTRDIVFEETATTIKLQAKLHDKEKMLVEFSWGNTKISFLDILNMVGKIPIPPYLNREANEDDNKQYQTVYAKNEGAVAAPTAGLHFTDDVLNTLSAKGIEKEFITLHVSAGTFQPVKNKEDVQHHEMHSEQIIFSKSNIEKLIYHTENIIPVGTTSMRSLESLYWYGVKLLSGGSDSSFSIEKLYAYENEDKSINAADALQAVLQYMTQNNLTQIQGDTEILIMPGYQFKICKGLVTNFHQPDSTLILLVAAFIGNDWREVYNYALENNFRFLSYGDSSLLLP